MLYNLEYLNIKNFNERNGVDVSNIIKDNIDNITYCIRDETLNKKNF